MHSFMDAKLMAKLLRQHLAERNVTLSHGECLELVARQFGVSSWNILSARIEAAAPGMEQPAGQQVASAPANAPAITAGRVAGVWNANVAGQGCRIATPQTKFGSGYRAGPLRCPAPLDGVKSWNVEGSQLAFYDQNGSLLARLYSSGGERFDGQTTSGQSVSLSR